MSLENYPWAVVTRRVVPDNLGRTGSSRARIVAARFGKREKRGGHDGADRVATDVLSPRVAAAIEKNPVMGVIDQMPSRSTSPLRVRSAHRLHYRCYPFALPASITAVILPHCQVRVGGAHLGPGQLQPPCLSGDPPRSGRSRERSSRALDQASCRAPSDRFLCCGRARVHGKNDYARSKSWSILAAMIKSISCSPLIFFVCIVIVT